MPEAGLTDAQKTDLYKIWSRHSVEILSESSSSSSSSDDNGSETMALNERSTHFVARLTDFFLHTLTVIHDPIGARIRTQRAGCGDDDGNHGGVGSGSISGTNGSAARYGEGDGDGDGDANTNANDNGNEGNNADDDLGELQHSFIFQAFRPFFRSLFKLRRFTKSNNRSNALDTQTQPPLEPRMPQGRQIVIIDHASFLSEMEAYEGKRYMDQQGRTRNMTFGAFLYHKPSHGLCVTNSAIALTLSTLQRRARFAQNGNDFMQNQNRQNHVQNNNNGRNPYINNNQRGGNNNNNNSNNAGSASVTPPESIHICARYQNVFPTVEIQDVKTSNAYKFITLQGRIIKTHPKRLRLLTADVMCIKCGHQFGHLFQGGRYDLPKRCKGGINDSNGKKCLGQKFELLRRTAQYIDCQVFKLQEEDNGSGNSVAGRAPRHIDLEVTHDLVDACHAGDCVRVAGVIQAVNSAVKSGRMGKRASETSTYSLFLKANSVVNTTADLHDKKDSNDNEDDNLDDDGGDEDVNRGLVFTDEQLEKITRVAHADHMFGPMPVRMAFPFDLLVRSLCPSIIGHDMVKAGILLGLLGGTPPSSSGLEDVRSGVSIRSNIHCLIVGDPGMGKSCLLLATTSVAARSVYVGGNTSTTTGLTVSLSKEAGGEIGIEAGALVLADQGVCCIDEFDKMGKSNQDGLLEAMEQQQISIAKAGVVASLPARCCVIAAANPKQGKYNMNKTVAENLCVSAPLLSRFDLVFILKDDIDTDQDKLVSGNIMNLYRQQSDNSASHNKRQKILESSLEGKMTMKKRLAWIAETQKPLPADLLKDYITYAREYCMPKVTPDAAAVLKEYFMTLRYPQDGAKRNDSVPITTRQLEALIRLSQARAKACLREFVLKEDAEDVVELMRDSVNQVHMDSSGALDRTRGGVVGKSKRKQKKAFIDSLRRSGQLSFSKDDFYRVSAQLDLPLNDFWQVVDELRYSEQPELRKGQDGLYYLL